MRRHPRRVSLLVAVATFAATWAMAVPAHSAEVSWTIAPTPAAAGHPESRLRSVSCVSAQACMAVGTTDDGHVSSSHGVLNVGSLAEIWNGSSWTQVPTPASAAPNPALSSVSCASAVFCVAVGRTHVNGSSSPQFAEPAERALVETWNGTSWVIQPNPAAALAGSALNGVTCRSSTYCIAVGGHREAVLVETWNGTSWRLQSPPRPGKHGGYLEGVSCTASSCMAVGAYNANPGRGIDEGEPVAERWAGGRWTVQYPPGAGLYFPELLGVSCVSDSFCLAVGIHELSQQEWASSPFAERWNGTRWTPVRAGLPKYSPLYGVSCISSSYCLAAGQFDPQLVPAPGITAPLLEAWTGARWLRSATPDVATPALPGPEIAEQLDPSLMGISCLAAIGCTAVGAQGAGSTNSAPLAQSEVGAPSAPLEPAQAPVPVLGRSADVGTVSGTVLERLPGLHALVPLSSLNKVPFGTVVDATHGSVAVTTAGPRGTTQTITVSEGEFVLSQGHSGMVVARLVGGDFSVCPTAQERAHIARATSKHQTGKHVVRKLWAEGHGNFTTDGNYASASVRGTKWLTEDLCEGTLIHVATDRVAVINRITHRHLIVKAGHSYLAKAP
jgi:putative hemolysin